MDVKMQLLARDLFCAALLVMPSGCAGDRLTAALADAEAARRHADTVVRDTVQEAAALRAELAAIRIAAAKQDSDEHALRAQVAELRRTIESKQSELVSLRNERDQLAKSATELKDQLAEVSRLRQAAADSGQTQSKVQALETALAALVAELAEVRRGLKQASAKVGEARRLPSASRSLLAPPADPPDLRVMMNKLAERLPVGKALPAAPSRTEAPSPAMAATVALDEALNTVVVQAGDTLSELARTYGVTLRALMEANRLLSDRILVGQRLILPPPAGTIGGAPAE